MNTDAEQFKQQLPDSDPEETREWMASLDEVARRSGPVRAQSLLWRLLKRARMLHVDLPPTVQTRYINTISPEQEPPFPGDETMERRIRRLIRWNAAVMVMRANRRHKGLGGHLSTYASAATLLEVGFNHFFRGKDAPGGGDHLFFQGHAAPGVYARAFLEGRITMEQMEHYRRETSGMGLSSYPHPRLMPGFWEYPTVSMGLGPISAIYQARFNRYLEQRSICDTSGKRVWAFLGDGECDEPETLGALTLPVRDGLDNLVFVVNCNLQRLDGPVRGNGKIIQELEATFRGAGWNVIKVIWGRGWDELLTRDTNGVLVQKMMTTLDGDYQQYSVESGAFIREHFFGPEPDLKALVADKSDDDLARLRRGGHDYRKMYAAYSAAVATRHIPTVILAKTVKGWTLPGLAGRNVTHQKKELDEKSLGEFRDLIELPIPDRELKDLPYYHPGPNAEVIQYMLERRRALGGLVPERRPAGCGTGPGAADTHDPGAVAPVAAPSDQPFTEFLAGSARGVEASTTMAFVRMLRNLMLDPSIGRRIVPIVPDEARTFGMESLFAEFKIYAALGQKYTPVDANYILKYAEDETGQILEEGITEAGSLAEFIAAATSYSSHGEPMIPFFLFYSMFGFQRVGDLIWAAQDQRARGFLLGATAGRTTLMGEGLQHDDGQSHVLALTGPAIRAYDPAYAYESAVIVRDGLRRMLEADEDVIYYLTLYNENYAQPPMPEGVEQGILRGLYKVADAPARGKHRARLLGSGALLREALAARDVLAEKFDVAAEVWSATSYGELRRDALGVERWNRLHPWEPPRVSYVSACLGEQGGPIVATSDYMKAWPDAVARWLPRDFHVLGTDGFGRSDTRDALRRFFEVDRASIAVATLAALARGGAIGAQRVREAMEELGVDPEAPDPSAPDPGPRRSPAKPEEAEVA